MRVFKTGVHISTVIDVNVLSVRSDGRTS